MAKIPFDIKFRPQIESGEYKVVTGDDRPVRIISWDKRAYGGRTDIVALVPTTQGDTETVQLYCPDGILLSSSHNEKFRLFIVTPKPELTEFEKTVKEIISKYAEREMGNEAARSVAEMLISSAKKELCKDCSATLEGYIMGRNDALKEMDVNNKGPYYLCPNGGGICKNHDCLNCPLYSTGINTTTGTSTSKVEGND